MRCLAIFALFSCLRWTTHARRVQASIRSDSDLESSVVSSKPPASGQINSKVIGVVREDGAAKGDGQEVSVTRCCDCGCPCVTQSSEAPEQVSQGQLFLAIFVCVLVAIAALMWATARQNNLICLNRVASVASILCAIDCTVFPVLLTVLPFLDAISTTNASAWLCRASRACALWFVGPVGGMTVILNLIQHRRALVGLWGLSGLTCIILVHIQLPSSVLGWRLPLAIGRFLNEWHKIISVFGCILLLSSQRFAHKLVQGCHGCRHDNILLDASAPANIGEDGGKPGEAYRSDHGWHFFSCQRCQTCQPGLSHGCHLKSCQRCQPPQPNLSHGNGHTRDPWNESWGQDTWTCGSAKYNFCTVANDSTLKST